MEVSTCGSSSILTAALRQQGISENFITIPGSEIFEGSQDLNLLAATADNSNKIPGYAVAAVGGIVGFDNSQKHQRHVVSNSSLAKVKIVR